MTMSIGYRTLSQHLNDLKKENFSLKLRIYFLEERIQHKFEESSNDVYKSNIELKVDVESLKQELLEKQQLLDKIRTDCGYMNNYNESELHQEYKQRQEEAKNAQELLEKKITFLQEEVKVAMNEADRMSALAETEKENCLKLKKAIEGFTADMTEARILQKNYCTILSEKDRMIQQMTLILDNKDSLINQLTEKNQNLMNHQIKDLEKSMQELNTALQEKENDIKNLVKTKGQDALHYENLLEQQASNLQKAGMEIQALQEKLQESKDLIKTLQESQQHLTNKLNSAHELTHNQECILQSLRDSLQSRDHEVMELYQIVDEHNATIAKLQDVLLKGQNEQLQTFPVTPSQLQFLDLQNTLFSTQMELQKKQMALRQKERQLTEAKRSQRLLEGDILEGQQQKETTWKHNQELHGALHKLQRELQEKSQHLKSLEEEKCTKEHNIERLRQTVSQKEQVLQEYMDVLHYQQSLEKVPGGNEYMMEKLRQRIKERDDALQKAVDDKFCAVEEKEKEVQRLKMIIRERDHDVERLSNVLSGNEETINSLDNLVKAKDLELEQISAAYKNLQWLKQETEEKYMSYLNERESIIHQLQKNLQERNEEIQEIRTCIVGKADICAGDMIEELKMCLQRKEKMLQDAVFARNQQAEEHMREVMDLLSMISSEKMDQISTCQCRLLKEQNAGVSKTVENLSNVHLEKLVQEKEKIIQLEVSALQSIIMKQNEQLREQAADIDALARNIHIKEELIKDLQVKLVDPEDIPTVDLLTQQIFILKENIVSLNLASQGHLRHTQKIFMLLEELATNKSQLNEALQDEKRLYGCLVQFHTEMDSSAIHNELLAAQALRAQLEDALMRTMEQLVALQAERKLSGGFGDGLLLKQDNREVHMDFQDLGYVTCGKSENEIDKEEATSPDGLLSKQDNRKVHMDFQDLGYETCGKSENEIDREETTSPECEEDKDMFMEISHMVKKDSNYRYESHRTSMTSSGNKNVWLTEQKSDANVLKKQVKKLKGQLQTSIKLMQNLQSQSRPSSKSHSLTEDDKGWQYESTGHSYTFLEQLSTRVSKLESYFYPLRKIAANQGQRKSVSIPGKYDWLIQAQARELSLLRQKVREGQSLCHILTQHLDEIIKSFEEMLRANDIDYFMGQSFREQLSQENELVKKLNRTLSIKGFSNVNKNMNEEFLLYSNHGSSESDGSVILDDQLSINDEFDGGSELSGTSDCYCYDQESTQDSDLCCNTIFFNNAPHMDIDKRNGLYIFCHTEDFSALKKNILDGKTLLHNIETCLQSMLNIPFLEVYGGKGMDCGNINKLFSTITILHNMLEESNSVLSLCWSGTQPTKQVNEKENKEEQVMKGEICILKSKLKEQEKLLKKASDHVKYANLAREGMEKQIIKQITATYGALKKARLNLQVKCSHNG